MNNTSNYLYRAKGKSEPFRTHSFLFTSLRIIGGWLLSFRGSIGLYQLRSCLGQVLNRQLLLLRMDLKPCRNVS